ncbi:MAG: zf-HC2 domain-containing protein, partial [Clostridia bacterium]|nr:zf-HC2 domain-containing protein [Clostridia bacterium]
MKITCNLAMDLVDVYTNSVASEETVNIVKEHLRECPACRKYYSEY